MQHRWIDVNEDVDSENNPTEFVGMVGEADLWIIQRLDVLICQYRHDDEYVSYYPTSAVIDHAKGRLTYENSPNLGGLSIEDPSNINKRLMWWGDDAMLAMHDQEMIARYLAIFVPYVFSDAERNEVLGMNLTTTTENDE